MAEDTNTFGVSRRTLAKGAAWSVPAAAVVAAAPHVSASPPPPPPPPVFEWSKGCATVGNETGGCKQGTGTGDKTPQVPVYVNNPTNQTLQFQILGAKFWAANTTEPTAFYEPEIWTNNGTEGNCGPKITTRGCGNYLTVTLQPGDCAWLWLVQPTPLNNSSSFWAKFRFRWVTPSPACEVVGAACYQVRAPKVISKNNCDNSAVTKKVCGSTVTDPDAQVPGPCA